jgi:hypothetical protein
MPKYNIYKNDTDKDPVQIDAIDDKDAQVKIKKITGKDPTKVTYYKDEETNESNTTDSVPPHDGEKDDDDALVFEKALENINRVLSERSYKEFATQDGRSPKQRVNLSIKELNRNLYEIERLINHASKLKTESGLTHSHFWKSTSAYFSKISERLLKINSKIREFNQ